MTTTVKKQVNVAPSSTEGHFVEEAINVVNLDAVNETFKVEGKSKLVTEEDCLITCQTVYDPFKGVFIKSKD